MSRYEQFQGILDRLPADGWKIDGGGCIRRITENTRQCPLTAAAGVPGVSADFHDIRVLGISAFTRTLVMRAADNLPSVYGYEDLVRYMRRKLLQKTGLMDSLS